MIIDISRKLWRLFLPSEKRFLFLLFPGFVLTGILDVAGIASIVPFMAVVVSPQMIFEHAKIHWLYQALQFHSANHFLIFLGLVVLVLLILNNLMAVLVNLGISYFSCNFGYHFSIRLLKKYLLAPYVYFLNRHTSDFVKNLNEELQQVVVIILIPLFQAMTKTIGVIFILIILTYINLYLALIMFATLGGLYAGIFYFFRKKFNQIDNERYEDMLKKYRVINETFGGIKEIKLLGLEDAFVKLFEKPAKRFTDHSVFAQNVSVFPRYLLELVAFGGVLLIVFYLLLTHQTASQMIPLLALYAFAGYRLMPALQGIFYSLSLIRVVRGSLMTLYKDFVEPVSLPIILARSELAPVSFRQKLSLQDIVFDYPRSTRHIIDHISLSIRANTTVAFVGETGAGKSTLVDIILGLLEAQSGKILIDDVPLMAENLRGWQMQLGYVPQQIYLCDASVASNIAFGIPENEIDQAQVERAAKLANIHSFIVDELPEKYQTLIGERGVRLSGGQRQRLGIARALYRNPSVLVLDEATSSLDSVTEAAIMEAIHGLSHQKTIIIIAHRLTTVRECDEIFVLDRGKLVGHGSYDALLQNNKIFGHLAKNVLTHEPK